MEKQLIGAELFLSLDPIDRGFVYMMAGAHDGGGVTLPSGKTITGEQMQSIVQEMRRK